MRNLLLILLLANILYFMWGWLARDEEPPGVAIVDEGELGPPLTVSATPEADVIASVGAVLGSGERSDLAAVVGRSCVTIGPFRDRDDADGAQTRYAAEGMQSVIRTGTAEYFVGHWVQIRNVPNRAESNRMLRALKEGGLADAYPVETEDEGLKISLGLFGNVDSAERIELQAQSLGFDADISPRTSEGTAYWVDVALPPGKDSGEIVELYGERRVALHDRATCPNED